MSDELENDVTKWSNIKLEAATTPPCKVIALRLQPWLGKDGEKPAGTDTFDVVENPDGIIIEELMKRYWQLIETWRPTLKLENHAAWAQAVAPKVSAEFVVRRH